MKRLVVTLISCVVALAAGAAFAEVPDADGMFPFVIEQGSPDNITNVQTWSGAFPEAGADGFIVARGGEFANKKGQFRALGTNICFGGNFPSKEKAERVAESLSRFGISVVRLHHMDSRDIWGKNFEKSTTEIDPDQLDKLDYLVAQFHKRGIYVNINLHVSRAFREVDGFANADRLPTHNKGVDNFDRDMIKYQKKYAEDLLQHKNPYTGKRYVDDPGVAVIEINNENSVVASWSWGQLDDLPEPYRDDFRALWNEFLAKKYGTDAKLRDAWGCKSYELGAEQIENGRFNEKLVFDGSGAWHIELDADARAKSDVVDASGDAAPKKALRVAIDKMGQVAWRPQFHCRNLKTEKNKPYQVEFKYRMTKGDSFNVGIVENHDPWGAVGFRKTVSANENWQTFKAAFIASTDDSNLRLTFGGFKDGVALEIGDVSFREGGELGIAKDQTFSTRTIPVPSRNGDANLMGAKALEDFSDFLYELEDGYWQEMFKHVKSLGAKSLTTGTQLQYGFWHNQAKLDYCDIHAYWNHPNFPRRQWDGNDWLIGNTCLANSPASGTLANLASVRVLGLPFTCSEYDHPYPNFYMAEGDVMLAAVAAFQDWSATFQFAWSHGDAFERDECSSFFDMCSNQVKLAHLPACYGVFARGDVRKGPGKYVYAPQMTEEKEREIMRDSLTGYHRSIAQGLGIDKSLSLAVYSGVELPDLKLDESAAVKNAKRVSGWNDLPEELGSLEKKRITNEFGEIAWDFQKEGRGFFVVDAPNSKIFSGFVGDPIEFDGATLAIGETKLGWATISIVKAIGADRKATKTGTLSKGRYLVAATGHMANADAVFKEVGEKDVTTAGHFGGSKGRAPILCEGIPATLTLKNLKADAVEVYALDASGARAKNLTVESSAAGAVVALGPEFRTLWYEIVVK